MHNRNIAVIGLGYVGLTVAAALGKLQNIVGFDIDVARVEELKEGYDRNDEISSSDLPLSKIHYTVDQNDIKESDFYIITVPTFVSDDKSPDFRILLAATASVGKQLKPGDIVVFESTVYPGGTEERCIPLLESTSNLICGKDFTVGYSPERINPADKKNTFKNIVKVISATDAATLDILDNVYSSVVDAGTHRVSSIKIAEAVKVVENTQRDINISIMNEISIILHKIGINVSEVLNAAKTKWNFLSFYPGLVGGQCMTTNSYLLAHKAIAVGFSPDIILAGRRVNEYMSTFITEKTIENLETLNIPISKARIGILGLAFKDDFPSFQDSKVIDIIREFERYDVEILVHDPIADSASAKHKHDIDLVGWDDFTNLDAIIVAVGHHQYIHLDKVKLHDKLNNCKLIMDVRGILDRQAFEGKNITYWRL
jgi:UDP-N-acetyl-D-galactosamine dehydrogenase